MNVLDLCGLLLVFVIIGVIGYKSTREVYSTKEFILAGRNLNKWQATISLAASDIGGSSIVGATAYIYVIGISGAWWNLAAAPAFIILGMLVARKLRRIEITTVPEFLGNRYNNRIRLFATILHISGLSLMISAQFIVSAVTVNTLLGISQNIALIISLAIVLIYTVGGGLIAVVNTDVFQFFVIVLAMIILAPAGLNQIGGWNELFQQVPNEFLSFGEIGIWTPISWMLLAMLTYGTGQAYLQRVFAAKNEKIASFAFSATGLIYIFYGIIVGIIGLIIHVLLPNLSDPNIGFAMLVKTILPAGVRGIVLGGIFAATMSTADSMLIGASTLFINDLYLPYLKKKGENSKNPLKVSRYVTIFVGLAGLIISHVLNNLINIIYISGLLYAAVIFCPLIFGVMSNKITSKAAELSIIISFIVGLISEFYLSSRFTGFLGLPSNILTVMASALILILASWLENKKNSM